MKSHKLVLCFAFLFVMLFWSCSQNEDSIVNPDSSDLMKGKPISEKAKLEYFQLVVNGTDVYNIGKQALPEIDFTSTNTYQLKYKITHPDPNFTTNLRFHINYDPSPKPTESSLAWFLCCAGDVVNATVTSGIEDSQNWEGIMEDPRDAAFFTDNWEFMDQKASAGDTPGQINPDPYKFYIWGDVDYTTDPDYEHVLIKTNKGLGEMFVDVITIEGVKDKGSKYKPVVTIELKLNDGSACAGAQIMWNWGGNIIGDSYLRGIITTNTEGIASLVGPSYNSFSTGEIIFTLKMISKTNFVYNPYKNRINKDLTKWPAREPYAVLQVP